MEVINISNKISLGEKIKIARTNKGLKQSDLSDLLGVRNTAISSWENNQSKPDINMVEILCGVLEVSPNYFFNLDDTEKFTVQEMELIKKYRQLDNRGKKLLNTLLDTELDTIKNQNK